MKTDFLGVALDMRLGICDLAVSKPKTLTLSGSESWLRAIAQSLLNSSTSEAHPITGQLTLRLDAAGFVYGIGELQHRTYQTCSRCRQEVEIPLDVAVSVRWRPPFEFNAPRELALSAEDLDDYFIEHDAVDLEQLVIDSLQCALPDQTPSHKDEKDVHTICDVNGLESSSSLVYEERAQNNAVAESPFAVLKTLRSP